MLGADLQEDTSPLDSTESFTVLLANWRKRAEQSENSITFE